jgi:beta-galactosidase
VRNGGTLISEGVPGYFGDGAHASPTQPPPELQQLFGAQEADVNFTPDLLESLTLRIGEHTIGGRYFKQVYRPTTGRAIGQYSDGAIAAVENRFGKGKTILIGTFPGAAYFKKPNVEARTVFQRLLPRKQRIAVSDTNVIARLHEGGGGTVLWVVNPTREARSVEITLDQDGWRSGRDLWSGAKVEISGRTVRLSVPDRDAAVLRIDK